MSDRARHTHPDVAKVLDALEVISRHGRQLAAHAADLHSLAYERTVSGDNAGSGSSHESPNLAEHGDHKARVVWHNLEKGARKCAVEITALESALRMILGGESPGRLRGTTISQQEFDRLRKAQLRRQARAGDADARAKLTHVAKDGETVVEYARSADEEPAPLAEYQPEKPRGLIQPGYPRHAGDGRRTPKP